MAKLDILTHEMDNREGAKNSSGKKGRHSTSYLITCRLLVTATAGSLRCETSRFSLVSNLSDQTLRSQREFNHPEPSAAPGLFVLFRMPK